MRRRKTAAFLAILCCTSLSLPGCHSAPPAESDLLNPAARLPAGLPVDPLAWHVVTTVADRAQATTATLTANDRAASSAAAGNYPAGAQLALTTWQERDDPHWFGARIPGHFLRLELVTMRQDASGATVAHYQRLEGNPAHAVPASAEDESRKSAILAMRPAQMP